MSNTKIALMTSLALIAFASNSLLCRAALANTDIDAASFTTVRLVSGAAVLCLIVRSTQAVAVGAGNWPSAAMLLIYAAGFAFAYDQLSSATGALLLFAAVQATMIGYGAWKGERLSLRQIVGLLVAFGGLIVLLLPGFAAPPMSSALFMLSAGVAWGIYSLRGRAKGDPTRVSAGNFARAALLAALISLAVLLSGGATFDFYGLCYAALSGAIASGLGYVIWYSVLPSLRASTAASVQLSVPVIVALGGALLLGESITLRLVLSSLAILGGIALVILTSAVAK